MNKRLGELSSWGLVGVGITYAVVVTLGIAEAGLSEPIVDPILAVMEGMTLAAAILVVMLMAAVYDYAEPDRKLPGLVALSFGTIMAGLTSAAHFVALTAGRQTDFVALQWPSSLYAVELLAWGVFLGLALLFAAPVFAGSGLRAVARWSLAASGALCLAGTVGPLVGNMALQRISILGYGVGLPIASCALALVFRREAEKRDQKRAGFPGVQPTGPETPRGHLPES